MSKFDEKPVEQNTDLPYEWNSPKAPEHLCPECWCITDSQTLNQCGGNCGCKNGAPQPLSTQKG